jgi:hypothetical protein
MLTLEDGETSSSDPPEQAAPTQVIVTAAIAPTPTPEPTVPPDRTSCEEIFGTEYRSIAERDWYRANCITPVP